VAIACLAAAAILIGGCGSNDSSSNADATAPAGETTAASSAATGPLTKAEFVKQADKICQEGLREKDTAISAALNTLKEAPSTKSEAGRKTGGKIVLLAILHVYGGIVDQLAELTPPKGDEASTEQIVQKYEAAMQSAEQDPEAASNHNPFQTGDKAAEAYGITSCIL
jgi:hypothetical protein